jgi:hypothetical protein
MYYLHSLFDPFFLRSFHCLTSTPDVFVHTNVIDTSRSWITVRISVPWSSPDERRKITVELFDAGSASKRTVYSSCGVDSGIDR